MNKAARSPSVLTRFPALLRLGAGSAGRRIPIVQTMATTDCGAACLTMVLGYYGKSLRLDEVRDATGTNRDGVDALALLQAAEFYGLRGRGVKLDIEELDYLEPGAILHWEFNHFVVFERQRRDSIDVIDPAFGRRNIALPEFRRAFTGVALLLEPGEEFQAVRPRGGGVWRYVRRVLTQPGVLVRIFATSLMIQLFALAIPVLTAALVDRIVPREDYHLLTVMVAVMSAIVGFNLLAQLVRAHLLLHLRTHLDVQMTLGFLEHLVSLPYAFFQRRSAGDLLLRLNSNATMREMLTSTAMSGLLDGTLVTIYLLLIVALSPALGLLVLGLGALKVLVYLLSRRIYHTLMTRDLAAQARSEAYLVEVLSGIETLKSMGVERAAVDRWSNLFVDTLNVALQRGRVSALVDALIATLQLASPLAVLLFGVWQVLGGQLSLGAMLGLSALAAGFLTPLSTLVTTALSLQLLKSYVERIDDVMETAPEQTVEPIPLSERLSGRITLEKVSFRHGPNALLAVDNVSVDILPGQTVAIVGRSGAGKSTLARLLLALYTPQQGRILYDGSDLSVLDVRAVRRQMGIVPQDPYLFGGSVRENILMSDPGAPLASAIEAAKQAAIHEEVMAMPMGYNTLVGDAGSSLSAGQRQRLALARALVHKPSILLLDEATSALDTVNERIIQENLRAMACTRIVIAHRLSTVIQADLILVMDDGRVVERGTHDELLARRGAYQALVAAQLQESETLK